MSSSQTSSSSSEPPPQVQAHRFAGMLDVPCQVDVILGTGRMTVRDCLKLNRNSIIRLKQLAGSDLEVRVHGVPIVCGEVAIIDESTAVRVTEVTPPPGTGAGA